MSEFRGITPGSSILRERHEKSLEEFKATAIAKLVDQTRDDILKAKHGQHSDAEIEEKVNQLIDGSGLSLSQLQRRSLIKDILDELQGYGPVAQLIEDPEVSDIIISSYKSIRFQKDGCWYTYDKKFRSTEHLKLAIDRIIRLGTTRIDESEPIAVFSAQKMRFTITIPPIAGEGHPNIAIRKFVAVPTLGEMVLTGNMTEPAKVFLEACATGKANIGFCGGMGVGKTTMLAVLFKYFSKEENPILIESVRECPLDPDDYPNLRILLARPANIEGQGAISVSRLIQTALTMMASRVLLSEAKGMEMFDVIQTMNIGHDGVLFTFHATSPRDAITKRIPSMLMMHPDLSDQYNPTMLIGNSLHFLTMMEQVQGQRLITDISEIGYDETTEKCTAVPIFQRVKGELRPSGTIPHDKLDILAKHGVLVDKAIFK